VPGSYFLTKKYYRAFLCYIIDLAYGVELIKFKKEDDKAGKSY